MPHTLTKHPVGWHQVVGGLKKGLWSCLWPSAQQPPPPGAKKVAILGVSPNLPPPGAKLQLSGWIVSKLAEDEVRMFKFEIPTRIGGALDRNAACAVISGRFGPPLR